jgi:beta-N-acetylhexosaminidase
LRIRVPNIRRHKEAVLAVLAVLLAVAGVALAIVLATEDPPPPPQAGAGDTRAGRASFLARLIPPPPDPNARGPRVASGIGDLVARMPVERKVAQLFLLGFRGQDLTDPIFERLRTLDIGGLVIDSGNYVSTDQLASLTGEARVIADDAGHVQPWVMAPQEGGEFNVFADLPPASAAADLTSNAAAFDEAEQAASALSNLGVNGVLAPVVDVAAPDALALGRRAYSDDPRQVAAYATAVIGAYRRQRVLTAAGHFPGLGSGTEDTQLGVSQVGSTLATLRERDLVPFRAAIRAGVPAVLMSHGLYATDDFVTPGSLSRSLMTEVLRDELGFMGIAITDDLADPPITALSSISDAAVRAIDAGADLLYISGPAGEQQAAYVALLRAVREGEISRDRLNEALLRNLAVKRDYGLVE